MTRVDKPVKWLPPQKDSREIQHEDNHDAKRHDRELAKRRRDDPEREAIEPLAAETEAERED
jgi:hypothetical protein